MKYSKFFKLFIVLFIINFVFSSFPVYSSQPDTDAALELLLRQYASKRGLTDWDAIVLGVNGVRIKTPLLAEGYFRRAEREVRNARGTYRVVTDYARIAIAFKSHGKDPRNVAGYDFVAAISGFANMGAQGPNAYIWSLIALYGQGADVTAPLAASILAYQRPSGGFAVSLPSANRPNPAGDVDLTAMAVTALAPYMGDADIAAAVDAAVGYLSEVQSASGGYVANNAENAESVSQVIIALCAAGVDLNDSRFVKNGHTLVDALQAYRLRDGAYAHLLSDTRGDAMATRQAALALSAIKRAAEYEAALAVGGTPGVKRGIFEI
jgi:hypothetical protein